jgi:hypothetical protein
MTGEIDFIEPNERGNFKKEEFEFEEELLDELKQSIIDSYSSMMALDFEKTEDLDECERCPFKNICKR